jgi:hypothetical protein
MPTGSPAGLGDALDEIEQLVGVAEGRVGRRAHAVLAHRDAADAATISGVIFAAGRMPPAPGLAPWLILISTARSLLRAAFSAKRSIAEAPVVVAAAEVARPDLPHEVAAVRWWSEMPPSPVLCQQPAMARRG